MCGTQTQFQSAAVSVKPQWKVLVTQLLHPSCVAKVRPENFHLELPPGPKDLCCAARCIWEPEACLHLLLLDPEQTLSFSVESTFTANTSAQPSVTDCCSVVWSSNKEMEKREKIWSTPHYNTANWSKGKKYHPGKLERKEFNVFQPLEERKHLSLLFVSFLFCLLWPMTRKKKKSQLSLWLLWLQVKMMGPQCKLNKELRALWLCILSPIWSLKYWRGFSCNTKSLGCCPRIYLHYF